MATVSRSDFKNMQRVLIKAGTSVVTHKSGAVAVSRIACIVEQIRHLLNDGKKVILVSSGAVGIGKQKLGHHLDPQFEKDHIYMRSFAATGQSGLMGIYEYMFSYYGIKCAQILLTDDDIFIRERKENVCHTINNLLQYNVVPILNENDVISTRKTPYRDDNIKILWDNDSLACLISIELKINITILLTDVNGLYKKLPSNDDDNDGEIIDIYNKKTNGIIIGPKSRVGRGGMQAKIDNALAVVEKGHIEKAVVVIGNGKQMDTIDRIFRGENIGTIFINEKYLTNIQLNPSQIAINARKESLKLCQLNTFERKNILLSIANALNDNKNNILNENKKDLNEAKRNGLSGQLFQRLKLTNSKLDTVIKGIIQIANDKETIGNIIGEMIISNTLNLKQITTPIGVLLVIFESRPDVLPQVIALSIKSGNGLLLKGGKEAQYSNKILYKIISNIISNVSTIAGNKIIHLIETRKDIKSLLQLDRNKIDLIIPRGSMKFVKFIENTTSIPVLGHSSGLCHLFIDKYANIQKVSKILIDSKCNYPSACNSVETTAE